MITDKIQAIEEVKKANVNLSLIDSSLLVDRDIVSAYMQFHSSNKLLRSNFDINIDIAGLIDDENFILELIKNLDTDYSKSHLESLLKLSADRIARQSLSLPIQELKALVEKVLINYNEAVKIRNEELKQKQEKLDEIDSFINNSEISSLTNKTQESDNDQYKRCKIGFNAKL